MNTRATTAVDPDAVPTAELGMWVFLATEILFFGVLFFGYLMTRLHHPQGFAIGSRHTDVVLGSVNTAVLLTSSLTMALAVRSVKLSHSRATVWFLSATLALGAGFLGLKCLEYAHDVHQHLIPWRALFPVSPDQAGVRLFFQMYFIMTGAHAVHLMIGLALVLIMMFAVSRGSVSQTRYDSLEVTGLYWHLVDIVWIFLYPLLYLVIRT